MSSRRAHAQTPVMPACLEGTDREGVVVSRPRPPAGRGGDTHLERRMHLTSRCTSTSQLPDARSQGDVPTGLTLQRRGPGQAVVPGQLAGVDEGPRPILGLAIGVDEDDSMALAVLRRRVDQGVGLTFGQRDSLVQILTLRSRRPTTKCRKTRFGLNTTGSSCSTLLSVGNKGLLALSAPITPRLCSRESAAETFRRSSRR